MTKIKLKARAIDKLPITGKRYDVRFLDQSARGLILRVGKNGSKTWSFWQKIPNSSEIFSNTFGKVDLDAHDKIKPINIDEATEWAASQRVAVKNGKNKKRSKRLAEGPLTFEKLYQEYVQDHAKIRNCLSSQENNERLWRLHIKPEFENLVVKSIQHEDIDFFISKKFSELRSHGGSGGRANNILSLMSSIMNFALRRRYITSNPCFGIKKIKTKHEWPEITNEQRTLLRTTAAEESPMMGLIVDIALITGARKQEILKARWEELDGNLWTIPSRRKKGGKEHVLTLPPRLCAHINSWRQRPSIINDNGDTATMVRNAGYIFPSTASKYKGNRRKGIKFTPENERPPLQDIKSPWTRIKKASNLEYLRFHDLRHDFGTQSARAGMSLFDLMDAMGHQNVSTTMLYINKAGLNGQQKVLAMREEMLEKARKL